MKMRLMKNTAIILASGSGKRMGAGKNKVLLRVGRRPMIAQTVAVFDAHPQIARIILVVQPAERAIFDAMVRRYGFATTTDIVDGGAERQYSAHNAVAHLDQAYGVRARDVVLFHNGANPFVTAADITQVIAAARKHGAAVVAHPVKDTIKEVDDAGMVVRTLERSTLWAMQTPQALRGDCVVRAFASAADEGFVGTDDVSLAERIGVPVKVVEASAENIKMTTPQDLQLAQILLRARGGDTK